MFGLFKKKKEEPKSVPTPVAETESESTHEEDATQPARRAFLSRFPGKEPDILGITDPGSVAADKVDGTDLWSVSIGLTAWMDEYEQQLHQTPARFVAMVDETLLEYLRGRIPRNFIISATVRPCDGEEDDFLMTDLPKPAFDPQLKALLEEQKKPVTLEVEGLGSFTLNRGLGWYDASVEWMGEETTLNLDQNEETLTAAQETAKTLMENQEDWDTRVRSYAAEQLLEQVNGLLLEEDDTEPYTAETLAEQFQLDSILAGPDGAFEFWFSDDDLFLAHPVHVTGTLEHGPHLAEMDD